MIAQVYSVPGQNEGSRKAFLEWKSIDLSSKQSLTCGCNINYYETFYHTILTLLVGIGKILAIFKTNHEVFLSAECPGMSSSWPN